MQVEQAQSDAAATHSTGRKHSQISRVFSVTVCLLIMLAMCVFWLISNYNTQNILRQQADRLGQTLALQTALQLTELVLANDLISMNVVLTNLTENSSIAEVTVLNISNDIIAVAATNQAPVSTIIPLNFPITRLQTVYQAPITLADSIAGYVRIKLDLSYIEVALINNLLFVIAATLLLMVVAASLITTYFQYLISFPAKLLAYAIGNIREGRIETCPEPDNRNEISTAIRQFNATAEFLAQNTFLDNFGRRKPDGESEVFASEPGTQDSTLLCARIANFHYLASTLNESVLIKLLNKYYFLAGKVSQLYNGSVSYCADGELIIHFSEAPLEEEQAFYGICAGQLLLQLLGDLADIDGEHIPIKLRIAVHSGQMVSGLYSPITQDTNNLMGKTLDLTRQICTECPDNSVLVSASAFNHAGAGTRVDGETFSEIDDGAETLPLYLVHQPMSDYGLLLERQAIQLVSLYID